MADKRCDNGHLIDEAWDLCPYCPAPVRQPGEVSIVRPRRQEDDYRHRRTVDNRPAPPARVRADSGPLHAVAPPSDPHIPPQRTIAAAKVDLGALASPRYVVGWLLGLSGAARGEAYPVRIGRNIIGRDRRSDIVVDDELASAHHADLVFRPEEQRFILMDHNSTNGTYVNGTEIEPRQDLVDRDVVRIGSQRLLFLSLSSTGFNWDEAE